MFGLAALALGGGFLAHAVQLWRDRTQRTATRTFRYSIVYLFALFFALVADKALGFGGAVLMADAERRRRNKNIALALILAALVALFYLITIVKMTGNTP